MIGHYPTFAPRVASPPNTPLHAKNGHSPQHGSVQREKRSWQYLVTDSPVNTHMPNVVSGPGLNPEMSTAAT